MLVSYKSKKLSLQVQRYSIAKSAYRKKVKNIYEKRIKDQKEKYL